MLFEIHTVELDEFSLRIANRSIILFEELKRRIVLYTTKTINNMCRISSLKFCISNQARQIQKFAFLLRINKFNS